MSFRYRKEWGDEHFIQVQRCLREEISTCPNIEIKIDVADRCPF